MRQQQSHVKGKEEGNRIPWRERALVARHTIAAASVQSALSTSSTLASFGIKAQQKQQHSDSIDSSGGGGGSGGRVTARGREKKIREKSIEEKDGSHLRPTPASLLSALFRILILLPHVLQDCLLRHEADDWCLTS